MPNRIIKESIRTSTNVGAMTDFQFRLWVTLITYVDDYGRGLADPGILRGLCFPNLARVSVASVKKALDALNEIGTIRLYTVDGRDYLCFPKWGEHQRIRNKKGKVPAPDDLSLQSAAECGLNPIQSESNPNTNPNPIQNPNPNTTTTTTPSPEFEEWWRNYPKKMDKQKAWEAWRTAFSSHPEITPKKLIDAIRAQSRSTLWAKDGGRYIPMPTKWLNDARWDDELHCATYPEISEVPREEYEKTLKLLEELRGRVVGD